MGKSIAEASAGCEPAGVSPAVSGVAPGIALAGASGILMALSFPRFDLDLLIWITLVPLLLAARGRGGWRGFLLGYLAGLVLEGLGFYWILHAIREFTALPVIVALLLFLAWLLYAALVWGGLGWMLGRCRTPGAVHLVLPFWIALEACYPRLFPWHIGGALYGREWLRQGADLLGASGLTYLILLVNALVYLLLEWGRGRHPFPRWTLGVTVVLLLAANIYGGLRLGWLEARLRDSPGLRVAVLQPARDPREKARYFRDLITRSRRLAATGEIALVVWPEGMDPYFFEVGEGSDPLARHRFPGGDTVFDGITVPLIVGGHSFPRDKTGRPWNTAAYILPRLGAAERGERVRLYHKNHRLLFGEWMPLEGFLPRWLRERIAVSTLRAGEECPLFSLTLPGGAIHRFRNLICYEAVLPGYSRRASGGVDFLVNITEDMWYGQTSHTGQHVSVLVMRAVENRVPLVRCANGGPSGIIEASGEFAERTVAFQETELLATLRPGAFPSLYRAVGFLFPVACLGAGLLLLAVRLRGRRNDS